MDILAAIFEIVGAVMVGNKNKFGFAVFMLGNVAWFTYGTTHGSVGLMLVGVVFFLINVRNYGRWSSEELRRTECACGKHCSHNVP